MRKKYWVVLLEWRCNVVMLANYDWCILEAHGLPPPENASGMRSSDRQETTTLVGESETCGVEFNDAGHRSYNARSGHDDLVWSVALAAWFWHAWMVHLAQHALEAGKRVQI